jgi:hypothetical protein
VNNPYGSAVSRAFARAFENREGGSVPQQVAYQPGESSYRRRLGEALGN